MYLSAYLKLGHYCLMLSIWLENQFKCNYIHIIVFVHSIRFHVFDSHRTYSLSLVVVIVVDLDCWCDFITITSSYGAEHATVHETIGNIAGAFVPRVSSLLLLLGEQTKSKQRANKKQTKNKQREPQSRKAKKTQSHKATKPQSRCSVGIRCSDGSVGFRCSAGFLCLRCSVVFRCSFRINRSQPVTSATQHNSYNKTLKIGGRRQRR